MIVKCDVVHDGSGGLLPGEISTVVDFFTLEGMKKRFDDCIVIAVSLPAHTGQKVVVIQYFLELVTGILTAPI